VLNESVLTRGSHPNALNGESNDSRNPGRNKVMDILLLLTFTWFRVRPSPCHIFPSPNRSSHASLACAWAPMFRPLWSQLPQSHQRVRGWQPTAWTPRFRSPRTQGTDALALEVCPAPAQSDPRRIYPVSFLLPFPCFSHQLSLLYFYYRYLEPFKAAATFHLASVCTARPPW